MVDLLIKLMILLFTPEPEDTLFIAAVVIPLTISTVLFGGECVLKVQIPLRL